MKFFTLTRLICLIVFLWNNIDVNGQIVRTTGSDCQNSFQVFYADCSDCNNFTWTISGTHTEPIEGYNSSQISFRWTSTGAQTLGVLYYVNGSPVTGTFPVTIAASPTPDVTITKSPSGTTSNGVPVTFSMATTTNGGTTPSYQWYVNGMLQSGQTGTSFTPASLQDGDEVYLRMTPDLTCVYPAFDNSDPIVVDIAYTIDPPVVSNVTIPYNSSTTLQATAPPPDGALDANEMFAWYTTSTGGVPQLRSAGQGYAVGPLTVATTYHVSIKNTVTNAESIRVPLTVSLAVAEPDMPTATLNTCGPKTLTRGTPPPGVTWYWVGTDPQGTSDNSNETYIVENAINQWYYLRAKVGSVWSTATGIQVTTDPVDLVLNAYSQSEVQASNSITLAPGFTVPAGKSFTARIVISPECNDVYNWSEQIAYDENGETVSRTRGYVDGLSNSLQNQSIDYATGKLWVSQPLYDRLNGPSASTLPAPIQENDFIFKKNFVTNVSGQPYIANDFDKPSTDVPGAPGEINNPNPVGNARGTLGWYYSSNNTLEPTTPTTAYPYSRSYTPGGPDPKEATSAGPGDQYKMGGGHEIKSEREPFELQELAHYVSLRHHFTTSSLPVEGYKHISTDPDGKQMVSFMDADGRTLASATLSGSAYDNWSYTYYNDLGQMVAFVAPNGVTESTSYPSFVTLYKYDHLGRLIETSSPDKGLSQFVYNIDGQIRFSQNQIQREANPKRFSYTNYDKFGRLIESGEYTSAGTNPFVFEPHSTSSPVSLSVLNITENQGFTGVSRKLDEQDTRYSEYAYTEYDLPGSEFSGGPTEQTNLFGQVSKTENAISKTWYSYDEFGQLIWTKQNIIGFGDKIIEYTYDFHGNVVQFAYQKDATTTTSPADVFYHHYSYDINRRLTEVYTSRDGANKTLQAKYIYYFHGPLKRVELAGNIQGIDFVYNIDGSLKMINHADPNLDPGRDGLSGDHANFMTDIFGETLDYNTNDYTGAGYNDGTLTLNTHPDQFSGSVKAIRWHSPTDMHSPRAYAFTYDNLNQMQSADWGNVTGLNGAYGFSPDVTQAYKEHIGSYDDNGNIEELERKGKTGNTLADYSYTYIPNTNKLETITHETNPFLHYEYNAIGQMTKQTEGTKSMAVSYNARGLVKEVKKFEGSNLAQRITYDYDDRGHRVKSMVFDGSNNVTQLTYDVSDAAGNTIAVYERTGNGSPQLTELPVYGASRIAIYKPQVHTTFYELSDHLGNLRGVIGNPETLAYTATIEDNGQAAISNPRVQEIAYFKNLWTTGVDDQHMNHTAPSPHMPVPEYSAYLRWVDGQSGIEADDKSIGPAIGLKVEPGDLIDMETWTKYEKKQEYSRDGIAGAMASILGNNFVGTAGGIDVISQATEVFQDGIGLAVGTALPGNGNETNTRPHAYLYYLLFDRNFNPITAGWSRVSTSGGFDPGDEAFSSHEKLTIPTVTITQPGYIYVFVANESEDTKVWFDDMKVTHQRSTIVAGADYYPFGLVMEDREITREDYRYGYQGQYSKEDKDTGWNVFELRMYDARIGRWISPDPEGQFASPYVAMGNAPHMNIDPTGGWTGGGDATSAFLDPLIRDARLRFAETVANRLQPVLGGTGPVAGLGSLLLEGREFQIKSRGPVSSGPAPAAKTYSTYTPTFNAPDTSPLKILPIQNSHILKEWKPGFFTRWSRSTNIVSSSIYSILDGGYVTAHFFMPWKTPAHLDGTSVQGSDGADAFVSTVATLIPLGPKGVNMAANKAAGLAFEKELAEALVAAGRVVRRGRVIWTPFGRRVLDIEVWLNGKYLGAIECKVGSSRYHLAQRVKDWWLRVHHDEHIITNVARKP